MVGQTDGQTYERTGRNYVTPEATQSKNCNDTIRTKGTYKVNHVGCNKQVSHTLTTTVQLTPPVLGRVLRSPFIILTIHHGRHFSTDFTKTSPVF